VQNGRLAVDVPKQMVYELHLPNDEDKWVFHATDKIAVRFNKENDTVVSMSMFQNGNENVLVRASTREGSDLPTIDELLALHERGSGTANIAALGNIRMAGTVRFVHQGMAGTTIDIVSGLDRYFQKLDFGKFGYIITADDSEHAVTVSAFHEFAELKGKYARQMRLQNPLVPMADWRKLFEKIEPQRVDLVDGKKVYVIELSAGDDLDRTVWLDADTGLVLKEELRQWLKGLGAIKATLTYDDYRDVQGVKFPFKVSMEHDINGRMVAEFTSIETNVDLPPDAFVLKPSAPPE